MNNLRIIGILIGLSILFAPGNLISQTSEQFQYDENCNSEILDLKIDAFRMMKSENELAQFVNNLYGLDQCGLDSTDIQLILTQDILGPILISNVPSSDGKIKLTYKILLEDFSKMVSGEAYSEMRNIIGLRNKLNKLIVDHSKWNEHKVFFQQIGLTSEEIVELEEFVQNASSRKITYSKLSEEIEHSRNSNQKSYKELYGKNVNLTLEEIKKLSLTTTKTILIYFRGDKATNCKKMEEGILNKKKVFDLINEKYIFVELEIDSNTPLPEKECFVKKRMKVNTIGKRNIYMQIELFERNSQPLFVKTNKDLKYDSSIGYSDLMELVEFLEK